MLKLSIDYIKLLTIKSNLIKNFYNFNNIIRVLNNFNIMSVDTITTSAVSNQDSNENKHTRKNSFKDQSSNIGTNKSILNNDVTTPIHKVNGHQTDNGKNGGLSSPLDEYFANYFELKSLCEEHKEFFQNDHSAKGKCFVEIYSKFSNKINEAQNMVERILSFAADYDFDEKTPGNGYRSFVRVTNLCIERGLLMSRNLMISRSKVFYRKGFYVKEIESIYQLLSSICTCLDYLFVLREWSENSDLFAKDIYTVEELFERGSLINQYSFYGRCLGFQYRQSMQGALRFISISMASFSESYFANGGRIAKTTSWIYGSKYFISPELRARRIVNISQNADINFCKSFWFLAESELMHMIPTIIGSPVKINTVIKIPPEPLKMHSLKQNDEINIPVPTVHIGPAPISARLLSYHRRQGMIGTENKSKNLLPPSKNLVFHCHGGGFVAQSSKSHELYLRDWAMELDSPILSIDYSLAPQAPFPRAIDEVFYAYCWALKNHQQLGSTAEQIVLCGDSAGANLCIGVTLKCIQLGIRKPDGIFLAYCPTLVSFVPSPARMLCLMDPILPFGFMMRCLKAYAAPSKQTNEENMKKRQILDEIRNASLNNLTFSLANSQRTENSKWEIVQAETEGELTDNEKLSPFSESDTFASASLRSQTGNTDIITPEDVSSCVSFEDDSQPITHMPIDINNKDELKIINNKNDSEKYVDKFIEQYADMQNNTQNLTIKETIPKTLSEENLVIDAGREIVSSDSIQSKLNCAVSSISSTINKFIGPSNKIQCDTSPNELKKLNSLIAKSPTDEFVFDVPKDPLLSPYYADEEELKLFPSTKILTVDMDPCLDDCVMFGKKLKRLNVNVSLDILEGLPHGFLNFTMFSNEAMEGSKMCVAHIKELLDD